MCSCGSGMGVKMRSSCLSTSKRLRALMSWMDSFCSLRFSSVCIRSNANAFAALAFLKRTSDSFAFNFRRFVIASCMSWSRHNPDGSKGRPPPRMDLNGQAGCLVLRGFTGRYDFCHMLSTDSPTLPLVLPKSSETGVIGWLRPASLCAPMWLAVSARGETLPGTCALGVSTVEGLGPRKLSRRKLSRKPPMPVLLCLSLANFAKLAGDFAGVGSSMTDDGSFTEGVRSCKLHGSKLAAEDGR
mmetsp:Transcript_10115/g.24293  ORF Transcript_10115/g.24293 Transcript_10115/m.24293 type:complete len:243 (+) Transcript_10115:108-836(+)